MSHSYGGAVITNAAVGVPNVKAFVYIAASAQPRYSLLFREIERELLPLAQEEGLAVIPFNPLAGGLLMGRYRRDDEPDKGRFSAELGQLGAAYKARYWREREFDTLEQLLAIAKASGQQLAKLGIARGRPTWYVVLQAIFGVAQFGIGLAMLAEYRRSRRAWGTH